MARRSADTCFRIDVRPIVKRRGASGSYRLGSSSVDYRLELIARRLTLSWISCGHLFNYAIVLSDSRPHLGGTRWWAECPRCSRRCAVLHILGPGTLGCRACLELAYQSTRETVLDRARRRARAARSRVGASMDLMAPIGKPPRMHWRIFLHHVVKERAAIAEIFRCLERFAVPGRFVSPFATGVARESCAHGLVKLGLARVIDRV